MLNLIYKYNQRAEIWWDSMPSMFELWRNKVLNTDNVTQSESLQIKLAQLIGDEYPGTGLLKGVTTNPRLFLERQLYSMEEAKTQIRNIITKTSNSSGTSKDIYWHLYKEQFATEAALWLPHWKATRGAQGWVCGQLPPPASFDTNMLVELGCELAQISPNMMIKVVGSKEGYQAIEKLTAQGISINNTLSFTVPQFVHALSALERGYASAQQKGIDLSRWRAVITFMTGRFGCQDEFQVQAAERDITLSMADIRWAEIALYWQIQPWIECNSLPIKMLLSSMRVDNWGCKSCFHIEKTIGSNCVYTIPPSMFLELFDFKVNDIPPYSPENSVIPADVLNKLMKIPYFYKAYFPDGMDENDFCFHPAFLNGLNEVNAAYRRTVDIIRTCR